jgi:hypothetical protein
MSKTVALSAAGAVGLAVAVSTSLAVGQRAGLRAGVQERRMTDASSHCGQEWDELSALSERTSTRTGIWCTATCGTRYATSAPANPRLRSALQPTRCAGFSTVTRTRNV